MRTPIAAGNWKMNLDQEGAVALAEAIRDGAAGVSGADVVLCASPVYLPAVLRATERSAISVGGQNMHWEQEGAYTGETSGSMLKDLGCSHCIIGHSERRHGMGETDQDVNRKVKAALREGLSAIMCVGETLDQRKASQTEEVIAFQMAAGLHGLSADDLAGIVVAYEPVWAIGTGETATPEQANAVHSQIRSTVQAKYGDEAADGLRILYGGSVKPDSVEGLMAKPDIDGALVGGASLKADSFLAIIRGCAGLSVE